MEQLERFEATPLQEHVAVFGFQSDKAAALINKLFS